MISVFGFLVSTISAVMLALPEVFFLNYSKITEGFWWYWACVPGWAFFIGAYLDAIDGSVARKTGQTSVFGGFFDSTLDRLSDAVVYIGFVLSGMIWPWNPRVNAAIGIVGLSMVFLISYTRSRAEIEGVVMKGVGFMERAERIFIMLGGYALHWAAYAIEVQYYPPRQTLWVFPAFFIFYIFLCAQTVYKRVSWAHKWLTGQIDEETKQNLLNEINPNKKNQKEQKTDPDDKA